MGGRVCRIDVCRGQTTAVDKICYSNRLSVSTRELSVYLVHDHSFIIRIQFPIARVLQYYPIQKLQNLSVQGRGHVSLVPETPLWRDLRYGSNIRVPQDLLHGDMHYHVHGRVVLHGRDFAHVLRPREGQGREREILRFAAASLAADQRDLHIHGDGAVVHMRSSDGSQIRGGDEKSRPTVRGKIVPRREF